MAIHLLVRDYRDNLVSGAQVVVYGAALGDPRRVGETDSSGALEVKMDRGGWLHVSKEGRSASLRSPLCLDGTGDDRISLTVRLRQAGPVHDTAVVPLQAIADLRMAADGSLVGKGVPFGSASDGPDLSGSGAVHGALVASLPSRGLVVLLSERSSTTPYLMPIGVDGRFRFTGLGPGEYDVFGLAVGYGDCWLASFSLEEEDVLDLGALHFAPLANLRVNLRSKTGERLPNPRVKIRSAFSERTAHARLSLPGSHRAGSPRNGMEGFVFLGVPAGEHVLRVASNRHALYWRRIRLPGDMVQSVDLELPLGRLTRLILRGGGEGLLSVWSAEALLVEDRPISRSESGDPAELDICLPLDSCRIRLRTENGEILRNLDVRALAGEPPQLDLTLP